MESEYQESVSGRDVSKVAAFFTSEQQHESVVDLKAHMQAEQ